LRPTGSADYLAVGCEEALIGLLQRWPCRFHSVDYDTTVVLPVAASTLWVSE
jgi:hypothetical protein